METGRPIYAPIEEVPIDRLLLNLKSKLRRFDYWQAFGRIHLLAYMRQSSTLPACHARDFGTRSQPNIKCAKGIRPNDEAVTEEFIGCTPIARKTRDTPVVPKCHSEDFRFTYPAPRGLPEGSLEIRHAADDHLRAARGAYQRVRVIAPGKIRPRLALAFIYDRFGQTNRAIAELRFILDQAERELRPAKADKYDAWRSGYWENQIVAAEAIKHLAMISRAPADLARIARLKAKLDTPKKVRWFITPIFVPLTAERSLASFVNPSARVRFDFTGQGLPLEGGWITRDAAWLIWDPHDKRRITSGFQLFGSVTWLTPWQNGYLALGALDDNHDGKITGAELNGLALWRDVNGDGISDAGEVKPVSDWDIVGLSYRYKRQSKDAWISENGVTFANGEIRPTYDWNVETRLVVSEAR